MSRSNQDRLSVTNEITKQNGILINRLEQKVTWVQQTMFKYKKNSSKLVNYFLFKYLNIIVTLFVAVKHNELNLCYKTFFSGFGHFHDVTGL